MQPRPSVVLVPSRAHAHFLKARLLETSTGQAGILFWTPHECRSFLLRRCDNPPGIISRENLHLLLAAAAEQVDDSPVARSVVRDPSPLMRALDTLAEAGWNFDEIGGRAIEPIVTRFAALLNDSKLNTVQQADRWLLRHVQKSEPMFESLLVFGFDGGHWPLWPLLQSCVKASLDASVCLVSPRSKAESMDQSWIGSWEEIHGAAESVSDPESPHPFAALADAMESFPHDHRIKGNQTPGLVFHIGNNLREQARAIVAQAISFLADPKCTRLGILFPAQSALSREVAARLHELDLPHQDGLAHPAPNDQAPWQAWLAFQKNHRLEMLHHLLETSSKAAAMFEVSKKHLQRALDDAFQEVLVDDLRVLAAFLSQSEKADHSSVGKVLAAFNILPEQATLAEYLDATRRELNKLDLPLHASLITERAGTLMTPPLTRATYLRWLEEISGSRLKSRNSSGNHPFARVHLLPYAQADGASWSHLILTSLNENEWPPRFEDSGFLTEKRIGELNARAQREGSQGEGHLSLREGYGWCMGPSQQRLMVQKQFFNLVESARCGLCATASLHHESQPDQGTGPGEFLARIFLADRGEPLTDEALAQLEHETSQWLGGGKDRTANDNDVNQTRLAFDARRDETKPFGEYEFALRSPPVKPITLACKTWEDVFEKPAVIWMEHILGVREERAGIVDDRWALVKGSWIHRWLGRGINPAQKHGFVPFPKPERILPSVREAAQHTRQRAEEAFRKAVRPMPAWWGAGWHEALWAAVQLAEKIRAVRDWPLAAAEWSIPDGVLAHPSALRLKGRMDLALSTHAPTAGNKFPEQSSCWIVDFKTGKASALSADGLAGGTGLQLALYALALQALGARQISASLSTMHAPLEPQLALNDILALRTLWAGICRMQDTGIFGMLEELRPEFSHGPALPLATLEVDGDILKEKWSITHPALKEVS